MSNDRKKQAKIINDLSRAKFQTAQNLRVEQERQRQWFEHKDKVSKLSLKTNFDSVTDDLTMHQKKAQIQQLNNLIENRKLNENKSTKAYSYMMSLTQLDKLNEQEYAKQAEKVIEKIQSELMQNFISTLRQPLQLILQKALSKKHEKEKSEQSNSQQQNLTKTSVQVQTVAIDFETKLKYVEKQLLAKNNELTCIRKNKDQLEKKYIQKYEQQRDNQKQLHQNFITIKDLKQEINMIIKEKDILNEKLEKQISIQSNTFRKLETQYQQNLTQIKADNQKRYRQYRQRINQEVRNKIQKLNQQKQKEINQIQYHSELQFKALISLNQSFDHSQIYSINKIPPSENNILKQLKSIQEIRQQNNQKIANKKNMKNSPTTPSWSDQSNQFSKDLSLNESERQFAYTETQNPFNSKEESFKSIDIMIKFHQKNMLQTDKTIKEPRKTQGNIFKDIQYTDGLNDNRLERKTTNEVHIKNDMFQDIEAVNNSPNMNVSMRKFRKIPKQVQFSVKKKENQTNHNSSFHLNQNFTKLNTEIFPEKIKNENQISQDKQNINFKRSSHKKNTLTNISVKSQDKKSPIKSSVKFQDINLWKQNQSQLKELKESKCNYIYNKTFKSSYKSQRKQQKYFTYTNQSSMKSSLIKIESSRSHSQIKLQEEGFKRNDIWMPELESKQYDLEQVKFILEKEFQYFKLTGILEKIYALEQNEHKNIKERILSVAKRSLITEKQKKSNSKNKDTHLKSSKTLKSILSRSLNKINAHDSCDIDEKTISQIDKISKNLLNEINEVQTFSAPATQDLQLFGGYQHAKNLQISNFNEQNSSLFIQNITCNQLVLDLLEYFRKLQDLNREKYIMYSNFIRYPTNYLNEKLSKLKKKSTQSITDEITSFECDFNSLKSSISKIVNFHEKQHLNKCIHLDKFLKKIGFFKYSSVVIN